MVVILILYYGILLWCIGKNVLNKIDTKQIFDEFTSNQLKNEFDVKK